MNVSVDLFRIMPREAEAVCSESLTSSCCIVVLNEEASTSIWGERRTSAFGGYRGHSRQAGTLAASSTLGNTPTQSLKARQPRFRQNHRSRDRGREEWLPNVQAEKRHCRLLSGFDLPCALRLWGRSGRRSSAGFFSTQRSIRRCWRRNDRQQSRGH